MKTIIKSALSLSGVFVFLETLLFNAEAFTTFDAIETSAASPLRFTIIFIVALVTWELLLNLAKLRLVSFTRWLIIISASVLPLLCALLFMARFWGAFASSPDSSAALFMALTVCLGVSAMSQIHVFIWDGSLDSPGLFAASGISILSCALYAHLMLTLFSASVYVATVAVLMAMAGAMLSWRQIWQRPTHEMETNDGGVVAGSQDLRTIVPMMAPIILESLLCTSSLGLTWRDNPTYSGDIALYIIALGLAAIYVAFTYRYWRQRLDASSLVILSSLPLAVPIIVGALSGWTSPDVDLMLAMLSQQLLLLFAWTGAMMLGRTNLKLEAAAPTFIAIFMLVFAGFMLLENVLESWLVMRIMTLAALVLLLYLTWFFYAHHPALSQDGENQSRHIGSEPFQIDELLRKRCGILAERRHLSPREAELLPLLAIGLPASAVAKRVMVTPGTVKTHRYRIYNKLGIHNHEELVEELNLLQ